MSVGPDPNGPKPPGVSDTAWYGYTQVDSSKPLDWWGAQDNLVDPNAKGYERYKSDKLDANGQPIQGDFEHPDACPPGTLAFGQHQCLSTNDPRMAPYVDQSQNQSQIPGFPNGQQNQQPAAPVAPQKPDMSTQQNTAYQSLGGFGSSGSQMPGMNGQTGQNPMGQSSPMQQSQNSTIPGFSTPFQLKQKPDQNRSAFGYARQY
jgi:hypothetical protein